MARAARRLLLRRGLGPARGARPDRVRRRACCFIAAPFLFSFESDGATVLSVLIGAALLVLAVLTDMPDRRSMRSLPLDSHIVLDYVLAVS